MKEDFLHYVWKFQKFNTATLTTTSGDTIQVIRVGMHNHNSGPDFFNGQVLIGGQKWAGNIEIHIKSSDWFAHRHEIDPAYDNVILHVVWEHDVEVYRKDGTAIPTVILKPLIPTEILNAYHTLFKKDQKWIGCQQRFHEVDDLTMNNWIERLYIDRLQRKSELMMHRLKELNNHWEALLFEMLAKSFGLKVNGEAFLSIGQSINFSVVQKCRKEPETLEALLMGQAGFFNSENDDPYFESQKENYKFLLRKFQLDATSVIIPKYFRLRPPNFPTIRLSQLANLYHQKQALFSEIMNVNNSSQMYEVFKISALPYWGSHYNFGVTSAKNKRVLTKKFIDLLIINTILPLRFCYDSHLGKDDTETLFTMAQQISAENNSITKKFNDLRPIAKNAMDSQGLLQLKNEYCNAMKCLQCAVGNQLLKA
ncbi:hypothetical protein ULMS_28460 [Patiriisocius marinistellae]|uniref:DUF2851 family protein n=1 Tax=Patiriisocius marinistellae TaxID=2494560 RepID=A0A5J4G0Q7_9FLAO|nr:DUF2851 family protein [Patiriisocius marinistellae]GEQ87338.1 hypothetical protein ULMS_28460 [Patiriisocius marinistellae]